MKNLKDFYWFVCRDVHGDQLTENQKEDVDANLLSSAYYGDTEACRRYIRMGANINGRPNTDASDLPGSTPLGTATYKGREETVAFLLEKGADPNIPDRSGFFPLANAVTGNDANIAELLLNAGADPNAYRAKSDTTPLKIAVSQDWFLGGSRGQNEKMKSLAIIKTLVEHGADVEGIFDTPKSVTDLFGSDVAWWPDPAMKERLTRINKVSRVFGK